MRRRSVARQGEQVVRPTTVGVSSQVRPSAVDYADADGIVAIAHPDAGVCPLHYGRKEVRGEPGCSTSPPRCAREPCRLATDESH